MWETSLLRQRLGLQHPIIQAPMAGIATPALAAAAASAGALGSLGLGASSAELMRQQIAATQALTDRPIQVNVFCHARAQPDPAREAAWLNHLLPHFQALQAAPPACLSEPYPSMLDDRSQLELLLDIRPAVVSFHFGLPPKAWIDALRHAGILSFACVTQPAEAVLAEAAGVDLLIAQGIEAGGHRGVFDPSHDPKLGLFPLLRLLRRSTSLPLIAAGGITDGAGIAAVLALGAVAAQLGTAFILCPESAADTAYRRALQAPTSQTDFTRVISGRPARGIINRMHRDIDQAAAPAPPDYPIAYAAGKALAAAAAKQSQHGYAAHWAGQGVPLTRALPASELVACLAEETRYALNQMRYP